MQVNNWSFFIQSIPFPGRCVLCGRPLKARQDFCSECRAELPFNRRACPLCALPLSGDEGSPCGRCQRTPPPFSASFAPLLYHPPVDRLISEFKFRHRLHLTGPLSRLFCNRLPGDRPRPELILPVPLHPRRLRERGFNQALELARGLAGELDLELDWRSCRRVRPTPPQSGLDEPARRKNLRQAFVASEDLNGRHVALFDDVITTGATVRAACHALRRAGVSRIDVWALARTPLPNGDGA